MADEDAKPVEATARQDEEEQVPHDGESASEDDGNPPRAAADAPPAASSTPGSRSKSRRKKIKQLLTAKPGAQGHDAMVKSAIDGLVPEQMKELAALNPSLMQELASAAGTADPSPEQVAAMLKPMNLSDVMTGLAASGKNVKDMGAYKFWQTQPVPRFGEDDAQRAHEGPLKVQAAEDVDKEPAALVAGFEWVTVDLTDDGEMKEVYELLNGHYVEDDEAMFRFNYIPEVLRW